MLKFILILIWALMVFIAAILKLITIFQGSYSEIGRKDRESLKDKLANILESDESVFKECLWRRLLSGPCYFTDRRIILGSLSGLFRQHYQFMQVSYDAINEIKVRKKTEPAMLTFMGESLPTGTLQIKDFGTIPLLNLNDQDFDEIMNYKKELESQFDVSKWKFMGRGVQKICPKCFRPFHIKAKQCTYCQPQKHKFTGFTNFWRF